MIKHTPNPIQSALFLLVVLLTAALVLLDIRLHEARRTVRHLMRRDGHG